MATGTVSSDHWYIVTADCIHCGETFEVGDSSQQNAKAKVLNRLYKHHHRVHGSHISWSDLELFTDLTYYEATSPPNW